MSRQGLFGHAVSGTRWIAISKAISQGLTWLVTIVVVRLLQPADYGIMATSGLLTIFAGMLLDAGLGIAFVQRRDISTDVYRAANFALLLGAVGAILLVQALALPAAHFFSEPRLEAVLRVAALQFLFGTMAVVPSAELSRQMRFKELGITQAFAAVGSSVLTLALALNGAGVWALVGGALAMSALKLAGYLWFTGAFAGFSSQLSLLRSYLGFSARLVMQRVVWFAVEQGDLLIVGRLMGAAPLGVYSVAKTFSQIPLDRAAEIVNQVSLPLFAAVQDDKPRWVEAVRKLLRLTSVAAFPLFWGMAAVAPVAVPMLLGEKWAAAVLPFMLFCAVLPVRMAGAFLHTVLLALGRADVAMRIMIIWALTLMPMFAVGSLWGVVGVAAAGALGFPIIYLLSIRMFARALDIPLGTFLAPLLAPGGAALGCALVATLVRLAVAGLLPAVVVLCLQILAGALAYVALLRLLSHATLLEATDLVLRFARRGGDRPATS